ncbi:beta-ketoacyl synthase N-terminal-like domain-containing protein [Streptomyces argenteolus]|uniref:Beta-ketoacyl synthase N-terminal-like domain-containing protein n=1 Tax=Streptomyces argenteolus TaxID=67274 RepID=A0ABW6XGI1_9ACTN
MPGVLPNVIPSRLAARYDLRGASICLDTGRTSTATALDTAAAYLVTGETELALVLAVDAGSQLTGPHSCAPAAHEGVFLLALAQEFHRTPPPLAGAGSPHSRANPWAAGRRQLRLLHRGRGPRRRDGVRALGAGVPRRRRRGTTSDRARAAAPSTTPTLALPSPGSVSPRGA